MKFIRRGGRQWPAAARYERRLLFWQGRLRELEERDGSRFRALPAREERAG